MSDFRIDQITNQAGTAGPQIAGITTFSGTSGLLMPSGPTEYRGGRGRGIWAGGLSPVFNNTIQYVTIATLGNASDFGDMTKVSSAAASSSSTRAVIFHGLTPSVINSIEYVTISSTGNSFDFGDSIVTVYETASASNNIRGLNAGGFSSGSGVPANTETIEYVTIASISNAVDFGDLTMGRRAAGALSSPTRACFAAGYQQPDTATKTDIIDYVTIATLGNAQDFGKLTESGWGPAAMSDSTRGVYAGRLTPGLQSTIDYITISSKGDATDFGDTTAACGRGTGFSNKIRGVYCLGNSSPTVVNNIDYITIATLGNAADFGDLFVTTHQAGATSDSHGGLGD
jgi:hypothetical protein